PRLLRSASPPSRPGAGAGSQAATGQLVLGAVGDLGTTGSPRRAAGPGLDSVPEPLPRAGFVPGARRPPVLRPRRRGGGPLANPGARGGGARGRQRRQRQVVAAARRAGSPGEGPGARRPLLARRRAPAGRVAATKPPGRAGAPGPHG